MGLLSNWVGRKVAPVDVGTAKARVREAKEQGPGAEAVAERLTEHHARRSAVRGFLTGAPGGLWTLPLLAIDVRGVWSERAALAAELHYIHDPAFFDDPEWWKEVWRSVSALPPEAEMRDMIRFVVQEAVLRRVGKAAARRIGARFIPVVGGVVGAAWNYAWVKREGHRMCVEILGPATDVRS